MGSSKDCGRSDNGATTKGKRMVELDANLPRYFVDFSFIPAYYCGQGFGLTVQYLPAVAKVCMQLKKYTP